MAAIAIPIVVLGSLYILSEQEKKNKENFQQQIDDMQNNDFKDKEKEKEDFWHKRRFYKYTKY